MVDMPEHSASTAAQMVEQWQAEWLPLRTAHWGDKIEWGTARTIASKIDDARLEAPAHRFTREDVENAARAHCDHFGEQGWFDSGESHEPKADMIEAMAVALSAIGEVDHG